VTGEPPAVARRRVRLALREAREKKGLTQAEVAEAMEWSASKIMRIETGEVTVSPYDLRPLLAYLGVNDSARVDELVQAARASRRRQEWWDEPRFREHLSPTTRQLIQYEVQATAVRHLYTHVMPGRLQTSDYAALLMRTYENLLPADTRKTRLEARALRRKDLLGRRVTQEIYLLLDESVLHRTYGHPYVVGEQLADLRRLIGQKRVRVRVATFDLAMPPPQLGSYEILHLGSDTDAVAYVESHIEDKIIEDNTEISLFRDVFEQLWNAALDEASTSQLIEERAREMISPAGHQTSG
jgi:transcriptional regulator with XRE-family HTH domain